MVECRYRRWWVADRCSAAGFRYRSHSGIHDGFNAVALRAAIAAKLRLVIQGLQADGSRMLIDAEHPSFGFIRDQCAKHGITQFTWKRFA